MNRDNIDGTALCKSFAKIGERVGKIYTDKQENRAKEKVKNFIYVIMKYVKHYNSRITSVGMKELISLCGINKRSLVPESKFELILVLNSLNDLADALDHKRGFQVFLLLVLTPYDDPVIIYYCCEVINKLLATTSPELLINLWCFNPLIESMITKLREYSIDKTPHPQIGRASSRERE